MFLLDPVGPAEPSVQGDQQEGLDAFPTGGKAQVPEPPPQSLDASEQPLDSRPWMPSLAFSLVLEPMFFFMKT